MSRPVLAAQLWWLSSPCLAIGRRRRTLNDQCDATATARGADSARSHWPYVLMSERSNAFKGTSITNKMSDACRALALDRWAREGLIERDGM